MSLTIALKAVDGLALAADSRVTEGYTLQGPKIRDDSVKFIQMGENFGILTYGLSDIGNAAIVSLKEEIESNSKGDTSLSFILERGTNVFDAKSTDWARTNPGIKRRDKDTGFIIGGYDREDKDFKIFNFQSPDFSPKMVESGCLLAGQWHIAKFFTGRLYTGKGMPIEKVRDLAVFLLNATMTAEKTVGGSIRLATVTAAKGFQWASEAEINLAVKRSEVFSKFFQEQLYLSLVQVEKHPESGAH